MLIQGLLWSSSILFQINEGIKVDISNQQKDWVEIILMMGKRMDTIRINLVYEMRLILL